ncbi:MAG: right-handed parallel beta-helix repeat-containing protein [Phycisphaeraceae bacterium]
MPAVLRGSLADVDFGAKAYHGVCDASLYADFNPYLLNFNRSQIARPHQAVIEQAERRVEKARQAMADSGDKAVSENGMLTPAGQRLETLEREMDEIAKPSRARYRTTLGQLFIDGVPMREVEMFKELARTPGTWMVDPDGEAILLHPPAHARDLNSHLVELSVRHTVFAPLKRGLGYITLRGLTIEHAANQTPSWGRSSWAQTGALSTRSGHHWVIEHCTIRHAKSVGIDCGTEGDPAQQAEFPEAPWDNDEDIRSSHKFTRLHALAQKGGYHLIRHNTISDNGHCGLTGHGHYCTQVLHNVIERNNCDGWTSPWWEFAGIKFHFCFDCVIEGNLIRDNDAHGIWLDNQWRGSRITRNVIVNNTWSGINMEIGSGPCLIDHNIIAHTRQGDGIYGHDVTDITIAHNLLYANANFGVWFAYATPRVKPEKGCWDIKTFNNMILGNRAGAIGYPLPWEAAGNNTSDGNLLMGGGEYLDEGSGPQPPLFQITSVSHMAPMQRHLDFPAMTKTRLREQMVDLLKQAGVPEKDWPNLEQWTDHYLLNLELWRAVSGNDQHSKPTATIRDGLNVHRLNFQFKFDKALGEVQCQPVEGIDSDFFGQPVPEASPLPGPFQEIEPGKHVNLTVWPVVPERGFDGNMKTR